VHRGPTGTGQRAKGKVPPVTDLLSSKGPDERIKMSWIRKLGLGLPEWSDTEGQEQLIVLKNAK